MSAGQRCRNGTYTGRMRRRSSGPRPSSPVPSRSSEDGSGVGTSVIIPWARGYDVVAVKKSLDMKPPTCEQFRGELPHRGTTSRNPNKLGIGKTKLTPSSREASKIPTVSKEGLPLTGCCMRTSVNGPNGTEPVVNRLADVTKPVVESKITMPVREVAVPENVADASYTMESARAVPGATSAIKPNVTANAYFVGFIVRPLCEPLFVPGDTPSPSSPQSCSHF